MCKCHWLSVPIAISVCVTICSIYQADVAFRPLSSLCYFSSLGAVMGVGGGLQLAARSPPLSLPNPLCSLSEPVEVSGFCVVAFPNVVSPFLLLFSFVCTSLSFCFSYCFCCGVVFLQTSLSLREKKTLN